MSRIAHALGRVLLSVSVRTAALLAVVVGVDAAAPMLFAHDDDGLGTGLSVFALLVALSALGGLVDGVRMPFARVVAVWVVCAFLVDLGVVLVLGDGSGTDGGHASADVLEDGAFLAQLVGVPALLGGGFTALVSTLAQRSHRPVGTRPS